jgi:hypothetical protein
MATRSDSEDMDVRDGLLFGLGSRIYDLSLHTVYIGETKHLGQARTNGCIAALVTIWELVRGKGWLVMLSWVSYLRSIMVTRD